MLFNYGFCEDGNPALDDSDANLVPALVEKIALPVLHHEISHCWDMLSTQETKNAVSATSLIIDYVPPSSEALAELLVTIRSRLMDAIIDIVVFTLSLSLSLYIYIYINLSFFISVCAHMQKDICGSMCVLSLTMDMLTHNCSYYCDSLIFLLRRSRHGAHL